MKKWRYAVPCIALVCALGINLAAIYLRTDAQANANRAGLVVQYPDGRVVSRCVTFNEPEISGYTLLRRAGLPVVIDAAGGGSICKLGNTGCNFPAQQCFCECQDLNQTCIYWIYYFQANNAWKFSSLGAALQKVTNGSVNGWIYGVSSGTTGGVMPPLMTLDQICGNAAQPPTAASQATAAPVATTAATVKATTAPAALTPKPPVADTATPLSSATPLAAAIAASDTPPGAATPTTSPVAGTTATPPALTVTPASTTARSTGSTGSGGCLVFGGMAATLASVFLVTRRHTGRSKS